MDTSTDDASASASAAIEAMSLAQRALDRARADRDEAIVAMHTKDGKRPTQIARALGMSASNVRLVLTVAAKR